MDVGCNKRCPSKLNDMSGKLAQKIWKIQICKNTRNIPEKLLRNLNFSVNISEEEKGIPYIQYDRHICKRIAKSPSMYLERLGIRWDGLQNWVIWAKSLSKCSSFRSQIPIRHISKRLEKGSTLINHPRLHISRCGILQTWESHSVKLILNKFTWIIIIQLFVPCTLASFSLVENCMNAFYWP